MKDSSVTVVSINLLKNIFLSGVKPLGVAPLVPICINRMA